MTTSNHQSNAQALGHLSYDRRKVDRRHGATFAVRNGRKDKATK